MRRPPNRRAAICVAAGLLLLPGTGRAEKYLRPRFHKDTASTSKVAPTPGTVRLYTAGEMIQAFEIPLDLLQALERGVPDSPDSTLASQMRRVAASAQPETLALPPPLFSLPLPGTATALLPPVPGHPEIFVGTRSGLVEVIPGGQTGGRAGAKAGPKTGAKTAGKTGPKPGTKAGPEPQASLAVRISGVDIADAARGADGTIYLLKRTWVPPAPEEQRHPSPVLTWKPGPGLPPDTIAVASPGACMLHLMPGDSLIWVSRLFGRSLDRLTLHQGRWEVNEVQVPPLGATYPENLSRLWYMFVPPQGSPLLLEQARGEPPRLISLEPDGRAGLFLAWHRPLQTHAPAVAWKANLFATGEVEDMTVLNIKTSEQVDLPTVEPVTALDLSNDGLWWAVARMHERSEKTRIELGRTFCRRTAFTWAEGSVTVVRLQGAEGVRARTVNQPGRGAGKKR